MSVVIVAADSWPSRAWELLVLSDKPGRAIDAIVCDVGDVVILFDRDVAAGIETRYGLPSGSFLLTALKSPASKLAAIGQIDKTEWVRRLRKTLPLQAIDEWLDYHGELNQKLVGLLASAKVAGVRVLFLSNATTRLWDDLSFHGALDLADRVFCSADIGLAKPDPRVYRFVADEASLCLARVMYVDDTASWVEVGRTLGMYGHVYETPDRVAQDLARLGVLP